MNLLGFRGLAVTLGMSVFTLGAVAEEPFQQRVDDMLPTVEEDRFLEIDWRTDLVKARQEANEVGKPMFMWMMNGHPFGAT